VGTTARGGPRAPGLARFPGARGTTKGLKIWEGIRFNPLKDFPIFQLFKGISGLLGILSPKINF